MTRQCLICGSDTAWYGKYQHWYKYKDGCICRKCYYKLWRLKNPDKVKATNDKWNRILHG
jgi:hypothetical protein